MAVLALASIFVAAVTATRAIALPKVGSPRPAIRLTDGWDRELDLSTIRRPLVVLYESEHSTSENEALKSQLLRLARSPAYKDAIAAFIVADVSAYDHWPARGMAKAELRRRSSDLGVTVYADFDASARKAFGAEKDRSNIFFYSGDGGILFASSGEVDDATGAKLLALLSREADRRSLGARSGAASWLAAISR